jgi:hypothetical protein
MADKNVSKKLVHSISKLIKKTETFEKVDTMLKCISLFMLITGTVTFFNYYKINSIKNELDKKDEELQLHMFETIMEIKKLNKKLNIIIEINENTGLLIENHIQDQEMMGTPLSYFNDPVISIKNVIPFTNNEKNIPNENNVNTHDGDDELLNECYDNIPCNNSKKVTGVNKIFGW